MERMKKIDCKTFQNMEIPVTLSVSEKDRKAYVEFRRIEEDRYSSVIRRLDPYKNDWKDLLKGSAPAVSPEGNRLLYVKQGESGKQQLRLFHLVTGEDTVIGEYLRIKDISWSQDGKKLLFTAAFELPHEPSDMPRLTSVKWIDRVKFKTDGIGLFDGTYRQIGIWDMEEKSFSVIEEGKRDLWEPKFVGNDCITYLAIPKDPDNSDNFHVYFRRLSDKKSKVLNGPGGPVGHTSVSPNGRYLAYIAHDNRYWEATNFKLYIFEFQTGAFRCLTENFDRSIGNYVINDTGYDRNGYSLEWDETGENIYTLITDGYQVNLYRVAVRNGEVIPVTKGQTVWFQAKRIGREFLAFGSGEDFDARIVRIRENGELLGIWQGNINEEIYSLSHSEKFEYEGYDKSLRPALYYPPEGEIKGVVLNIHGGPHYCHGYDLSFDVQLLAANGFGVILCNPAGSQGSGEELSRASYHDWGGKDYRELLSCVEAAKEKFLLKKLPFAVMGGSYGGFMTNWMIGHTDSFVCAISERSTCNRYSQAGTSDCAFRYGMFEFDGAAWENPEHYMEHSPITYVKNVHTPVLLIHGDQDMNCPISQSEEWYSALKMEGKEAYLAVFPGQYHSLTGKGSPKSRLDRYRLIIWWLNRYMEKERKNV